jgi:hypothetical protein
MLEPSPMARVSSPETGAMLSSLRNSADTYLDRFELLA